MAFGFPVGGSITPAFQRSLQTLFAYELAKPESQRLMARTMYAQGLYVGKNRQEIAHRFVTGEHCDWLLQVDTDIEFPPTLIETMLALADDERLVLAANVPLGDPRLGAHATVAYRKSERPGMFDNLSRMPADLFKVDGVATAVLLTHRKVFEAIADAEGQTWFVAKMFPDEPDPSEWSQRSDSPMRRVRYIELGEDLSFCCRAQEQGFDIWCAYVRGLKHYKTCALSDDHERDAVSLREMVAAEDGGDMGEIVPEDPTPPVLFGDMTGGR